MNFQAVKNFEFIFIKLKRKNYQSISVIILSIKNSKKKTQKESSGIYRAWRENQKGGSDFQV